MQNLDITLIQSSLHWENAAENLRHFEDVIRQFKNATDLILLPEMFSTGFSMNAEKLAERMDGNAVEWMRRMAQETNAVITGSLIINDDGKFFNRLIWMRPDGTHDYYDKRHLFGLGDEHSHYSTGNRKLFVTLKGWNICPLICYDLRFPVWCRN
jgi:predicted amidohydrolase